MYEHDRVKLLFGPYRMPRFRVGRFLRCTMRGKVRVRGISDAPIMWPFTRNRDGRGTASLILCVDLARAVRRESEIAVAHWWGVSQQTVWKWRVELGVGALTKGTSDLRSRWAPETVQSPVANARRAPTLKSPERAAKIAAARRGKPRPATIMKALHRGNIGRRASKETRQKMSVAAKRRGVVPPAMKGPPWTPDEDALVGTMKDRDVGERIGRSESAVSDRRYVLGVAAFTKRKRRGKPITWTPAKERLLGTMPDGELARKLRCSPMAVFYRRKRLKIPAFRK